jgi:hypothetical protein
MNLANAPLWSFIGCLSLFMTYNTLTTDEFDICRRWVELEAENSEDENEGKGLSGDQGLGA